MATQVTNGAVLQCSFGAAPATLVVPPASGVTAGNMPAATVSEFAIANIASFGMCSSLSNPTVASATTAALGVLTPMTCVPAITSAWKPGAVKVTIGNKSALTDSSVNNCAYGGVIQIKSAGQTTTDSK